MILRDKITTSDRLVKLIDFEKEQINEKRKKIKSLMKDTEEGVQRYKLTNDKIIANTKRTIKVLTEKVLVATYTAGYLLKILRRNILILLIAFFQFGRAILAISKWFGLFLLGFC